MLKHCGLVLNFEVYILSVIMLSDARLSTNEVKPSAVQKECADHANILVLSDSSHILTRVCCTWAYHSMQAMSCRVPGNFMCLQTVYTCLNCKPIMINVPQPWCFENTLCLDH